MHGGERRQQVLEPNSPLLVPSRHDAILGRRRTACRAIRRRLHAGDHRASRGQLRLHRGRPTHPRFHVRADERDPRPRPSGDRGDREPADRHARPPVQRDAVAAGCRPVPQAGGVAAGAAVEGAAAHHRRRIERSGCTHGEARDRRARGGVVRGLVARDDAGGGRGDVQLRPQGLRPRVAGELRDPDAERVPARLHHTERRTRLAPAARLRLRHDRCPVGRKPRRLPGRADPELRRCHRRRRWGTSPRCTRNAGSGECC